MKNCKYTYIPNETVKAQFGEISTGYYEEKKSKFYSYIFKITNISEVQEYINKVKLDSKEARHIVYAYVLSDNYKYYDDGEPSGTAGKMIYSIMEKQNITNNLIIVVRYFGGTLLGAGNLARAYLKSAKNAVDNCETILFEEMQTITLSCNFDEENVVREEIKAQNGEILYLLYKEKVYMKISVPKNNSNVFQKWIENTVNI